VNRYTFAAESVAKLRNKQGGLLPEFASALVIFIMCLLIPLANLSAVPIRYVIAFGMVSDLAHRLALQEKRSKAIFLADAPSSYQDLAYRAGVHVVDCNVAMIVQNGRNEMAVFPEKKRIPAEWLPGGTRGQCSYVIQSQTAVAIAPLICIGPNIPALTAPVQMTITTKAPWENLGMDPMTQEYFINE
jgi:hypothetical protein